MDTLMDTLTPILFFVVLTFVAVTGILELVKKRTNKIAFSIMHIVIELVFGIVLLTITLYVLFGYGIFSLMEGVTFVYLLLAFFLFFYSLERFYKLYKLKKKIKGRR